LRTKKPEIRVKINQLRSCRTPEQLTEEPHLSIQANRSTRIKLSKTGQKRVRNRFKFTDPISSVPKVIRISIFDERYSPKLSKLKNDQLHSEQQLISILRKGSPFAFELLFERYSQKLYRFSLSYLKSETEAEEIVQDVFLKLWENRNKLRNETSFQSYLFTIAFNAIRKHFNRKNRDERFRSDLLETISEENPSLENHLDFETLVGKLDELIEQMPLRRKEIFLKRKKEEKSVHDIATEMHISPKTVENQITEAMKYLKEEFGNDRISGMLFFYIFLD